MKRLVSLLFLLFPIIFGVFLFITPPAQAYLWCEGYSCGGYQKIGKGCNTGLVPPANQICDNAADNQYCGKGDYCPYTYCGWTSSACCSGANFWTKYWQECDTFTKVVNGFTQYSCQTAIYPTGKTCSMGDKCATTPTTILQPGQCDCSVGPFNYKTCCDSNGNQNNATCYSANDGTGNIDGVCPNLTVRCGQAGQPACGQPACDTLAPPQTVQGTITDDKGNLLSGVVVTITNNTKGTNTTATTNGSGFFSNNTLVRRGNSFTVSPNKSAGAAPCNAGMICGNSWSPNSPNPYTAGNGSGCSVSSNTWTCNFSYTQGVISGKVYIDYNHNGIVDAEDITAPAGLLITDSSGKTGTTDATGSYSISPLNQGSHTQTLTVPAGYAPLNGNNTNTVTIGPNATTSNFFITPLYTISGVICNDPGIDASCMQSEDTTLPGTNSVIISKVTADGTTVGTIFQAAYAAGIQVISGTYSIAYSTANGYYFTASKVPGKSLPPYKVSVGQSSKVDGSGNPYTCTAPTAGSTDASCSNHNIINMNFAVSNLEAWSQGWCTDLRLEAPSMDIHVPNSGACIDGGSGTSTSNAYAIVCLNNNAGAGVYYAGQNSPTFGYNGGQASLPNYVVGASYPENFTPVSGINRASYTYLRDTINSSGVKTTDLGGIDPVSGTPYCGSGGTANCDLEASLPDGIYTTNGDLTLNLTSAIPDPGNNKSYVFLIAGKLTINSNVLVPSDSSVVFASKGDIFVSGNVGQALASYTSATPNLEGFYSTEGNFWILTNNTTGYPCGAAGTPIDKRLNIDGGVIVGGTVQNQRELCKYDAQCPVTTYQTGYTYLLNAPAFVKHKSQLWQEKAPSGQ